MDIENRKLKHEDGEDVLATPEAIDLDVLDGTLSFFIRCINAEVSRDWDMRIEDLAAIRGVGKVSALLLIGNHPGIRPSVIAQMAMKDRSEMGRILDGLKANGLITRRTSTIDSRARALFLTEEGERVRQEIRRRVRESRAFLSDMSDVEYNAVIGPLRALYWRLVTSPRAAGGDPQ